MIMFNSARIMIVAAHPDDELLGTGATMHRLIHEQDVQIHVVILGEGITSRSEQRDKKIWEKELVAHQKNIFEAQKNIGYSSVSIYQLPDNRFDTVALLDIVKIIEAEKIKFKPDIIFTHHGGDLNIDHQRTFEAVMTGCRPMKGESTSSIITFETPSSTEWQASTEPRRFTPNFFMKVSTENVQAKINGMECYQYEKRSYPHPRSSQALTLRAQNWGVSAGCDFAEAFCIVRYIN